MHGDGCYSHRVPGAPLPLPDRSGIDRRSLVAALTVGWLTRGAHAAISCAVPDVLFVCPAGTVKSAIAREMLKQWAAKRHVAVHTRSRGVAVVDHVNPELTAKLKRDGIDPLAEQPRVLVPEDLAHPDIVITFDEAARAPGLEHARNWTIRGFLADYEGAKADLAARIESLLDELQRRRCAA